jgi:hypothetical protein
MWGRRFLVDKMNTKPTAPCILDYSQRPAAGPPSFRCGFVSLALSVFLFACMGILLCFGSRNGPRTYHEQLMQIGGVSVLNLALGIGGLFQKWGRFQAILGAAFSLFILICVAMILIVRLRGW